MTFRLGTGIWMRAGTTHKQEKPLLNTPIPRSPEAVLVHAIPERVECEITFPRVVGYRLELPDERLAASFDANDANDANERPVRVILDPDNSSGSTRDVGFRSTSAIDRTATLVGRSLWETSDRTCHVNYAACDSSREAEFCRFVENDFLVRAYVKNEGLGFEVPYVLGSELHVYRPDFILLLYDGKGEDDLLRVIVEVKGFRRQNANDKAATMRNHWIPGVNALGSFGRWAFLELGGSHESDDGPDARISLQIQYLDAMRVLLQDVHAAAATRLALTGGSQPDIEYIPRRRGEFFE